MSSFVKTWLVALLALILPLEGAVAASGMLCHARSSVAAAQQAHPAAHAGTNHGVIRQVAHGHAQHGSDAHSAHGGASATLPADRPGADPSFADPLPIVQTAASVAGHDAGCPSCSGICSASPLPASHALGLAPDQGTRARPVPAHLAPPSHVSAGLERPPRSL